MAAQLNAQLQAGVQAAEEKKIKADLALAKIIQQRKLKEERAKNIAVQKYLRKPIIKK